MAIRNFYTAAEIDGRSTQLTGGPAARRLASTTSLPVDTLVSHDMFGVGRVLRTRDEFVASVQFASLSGPIMVMRSYLEVYQNDD